MGTQPFGLGVSAAEEAALKALPFVAGVKLFAGGNALRIVRRGIEVESADQIEVEHGN